MLVNVFKDLRALIRQLYNDSHLTIVLWDRTALSWSASSWFKL